MTDSGEQQIRAFMATPSATNTFDLGSAAREYKDIFTRNATVSTNLAYTASPVVNGMLMSDASGNATWMRTPMGEASWEGNNASTDFVLAEYGTFKKLVVTGGGTTLSPDVTGMWSLNAVENRLQFTGSMTGLKAHIAITTTLQGSANNHEAFIQAHKNGTKINGSLSKTNLRNGQPNTTVIHCFTGIEPNDYLEIFVTTDPVETADNLNITAETGNIFAMLM